MFITLNIVQHNILIKLRCKMTLFELVKAYVSYRMNIYASKVFKWTRPPFSNSSTKGLVELWHQSEHRVGHRNIQQVGQVQGHWTKAKTTSWITHTSIEVSDRLSRYKSVVSKNPPLHNVKFMYCIFQCSGFLEEGILKYFNIW